MHFCTVVIVLPRMLPTFIIIMLIGQILLYTEVFKTSCERHKFPTFLKYEHNDRFNQLTN